MKLTPRAYQLAIYHSIMENGNTLVVLPTGLGKTLVSLMVIRDKIKEGKVLLLTPTKPLAKQHLKSVQEILELNDETVTLVTGEIPPEKRKVEYAKKVIISTPQCVDGDTRIFILGKGQIKIKEYVEGLRLKKEKYFGKTALTAKTNDQILSFDGRKIKASKISDVWKIKTNKNIEIKTETGLGLICRPEHPLLTIDKTGKMRWKKATDIKNREFIASIKQIDLPLKEQSVFKLLKKSKLRINDKKLINDLLTKHKMTGMSRHDFSKYKRVTIPLDLFFKLCKKCKIKIPNKLLLTNKTGKSKTMNVPAKINKEMCYIIGAMLGDGHIGNSLSKGKEVIFSALNSQSIMEKFHKFVLKNFGIKPKKDDRKGLIYYSTAFGEVLMALGIPAGKKGDIIRIPKYIYHLDEELIYHFISGFFDTDGSASKHQISFSSISKEMINDLRWLLYKVGIVNRIRMRQNRCDFYGRQYKSQILYTLEISGVKYLQQLLKKGSLDTNKTIKLTKTIKKYKHITRSKEILPINELLKKAYEEHRKNGGKVMLDVCNAYSMNMLSYENLKRVTSQLNAKKTKKRINALMSLPIRWVRVKNIKRKDKQQWLYDVTVPRTHNFVGNGIINHNTIRNDFDAGRLEKEFSLVIFDECHRAIGDYAYTQIAANTKDALHVGLTASPGGKKARIKEVLDNLQITNIEIRTHEDPDVKQYIQESNVTWVPVELTPRLRTIKKELDKLAGKYAQRLAAMGFPPPMKNKGEFIKMGGRLRNLKHNIKYPAMVVYYALLHINHISELLETQGLFPVREYIKKLAEKKSKSVSSLVKEQGFQNVKTLCDSEEEHPKLAKLVSLLKNLKGKKIIVFVQYRDQIKRIEQELLANDISTKQFVGKKDGVTRKMQEATIAAFREGEFDVLVSSSIGEEGLDIPKVDCVIFYEPIPSEIRSIQRRGRAARFKKGDIYVLMTRGTRDEYYSYASKKKEQKMKIILESMKLKMQRERNKDKKVKKQGDKKKNKPTLGQTKMNDFL